MTEKITNNRPWHLIMAAVVSLAILVGFYLAGLAHFKSTQWADFGNFVAGAAGVLLTSLSFLALLYTIHIQSNELALSRQELALTREEMGLNRLESAKSAEALSEQVMAASVQNFEQTLFQSLGFLANLVEQFEYKSPFEDNPRRGLQAFFSMYQRLGHHSVNLGGLPHNDGDLLGSNPQMVSVFDQLSLMLAPYFRTLYNIYRILDESNYSQIYFYNRIIRAQIPDHAMVILFYNSLTERGCKFQKYIVKYQILDNLPISLLFNPHHAEILAALPTARALAFFEEPVEVEQ